MLEIRHGRAVEHLVGLTTAYAGIAETGTLMLLSAPERRPCSPSSPRPRSSCSRASGSCARTRTAALLRQEHGALPRSINFITGPSRSGDIEQTLQLGAHGPRRLCVLLVDEPPGARARRREPAAPPDRRGAGAVAPRHGRERAAARAPAAAGRAVRAARLVRRPGSNQARRASAALDPHRPVSLDRRTWQRLKRGQLSIEQDLDLHGRTQDEAHRALGDFLAAAQAAGCRCVLVVTGKGPESAGTCATWCRAG